MSNSNAVKISQRVLDSLPSWYRCAAIVLSRDGTIEIVSDDEASVPEVKK